MPRGRPRPRPAVLSPVLSPVLLLAALGLGLAACTGTTERPTGPSSTLGLSTPSAATTVLFDCGRVDLTALGPAARRTALGNADVCLRDALLRGQPARFERVDGSARTTYQVTGRGELAVTDTTTDTTTDTRTDTEGARQRYRRCTGATGLFLLGRCTRDPGAAR